MKKNLYAVIDTASGIYDGPMPLNSDAVAERGFCDAVADGQSALAKHPEDFAMVKVGVWNDGTGEVEDLQNTTIITGLEALARNRSASPKVGKGSLIDFDNSEEVANFGGTN